MDNVKSLRQIRMIQPVRICYDRLFLRIPVNHLIGLNDFIFCLAIIRFLSDLVEYFRLIFELQIFLEKAIGARFPQNNDDGKQIEFSSA